MIEVYDRDNRVIKCEILFTFEKDNKKFVVYKDKEDEILASYYKENGDKYILEPIMDEKDYDLVDIELEKWWNQSE